MRSTADITEPECICGNISERVLICGRYPPPQGQIEFAISFCLSFRCRLKGCAVNSSWLLMISSLRRLAVSCGDNLPSSLFSFSAFISNGFHASFGWSWGGAQIICLLPPLIIRRWRYCIPGINWIYSLPSFSLRYLISVVPSSVVRCPPWWFLIIPLESVIKLHLRAKSSGDML